MSKSSIFILALAIVSVVAGVYYYFFKEQISMTNNANPKIGHFVSQSEPKFEFDYPLFDYWRTEVRADEIRYHPDPAVVGKVFEYPPSINMRPLAMKVTADFWEKAEINPKGVKYVDLGYSKESAQNHLAFYFNGETVELLIPKKDNYKFFSGELIWNTVLNSFVSGN